MVFPILTPGVPRFYNLMKKTVERSKVVLCTSDLDGA